MFVYLFTCRGTNTERSIRRHGSSGPNPPPNPPEPDQAPEIDPRERTVLENLYTTQQLFQSILPLLFDVLNAAPGPTVQQKCLQTIIRMVRVAQSDIIQVVLHDVPVIILFLELINQSNSFFSRYTYLGVQLSRLVASLKGILCVDPLFTAR